MSTDDSIGTEDRHEYRIEGVLPELDLADVSIGSEGVPLRGPDGRIKGKVTRTWHAEDGLHVEAVLDAASEDSISNQVIGRYSTKNGISPYGFVVRRLDDSVSKKGA